MSNVRYYSIKVTGSHNRKAKIADQIVTGLEVARAAIETVKSIGELDDLHKVSVDTALEFWTCQEVSNDLIYCGQCDIVLCGGFYCVEIREQK